jgi:hypothetical protein
MFNSSRQEVNIVLTKDEIHTLINVVIVNPTRAYLFPQFDATQKFITYDATQAKEKGYHV